VVLREIEKYGQEEADRRRIEWKVKISENNKKNGTELTKKGRYALWVEKYGQEIADIKHSEWRQKISDHQKFKMENGWTHSDEAKAKISQASKKPHTEESKQKMRKPKPEGFGEKTSKAQGIQVEQLDLDGNFIKLWDSLTQASTTLKIKHISDACKGKRKTAGKFKWRYKNNE